MTEKTKKEEKLEKLSAALKENLQRRKASQKQDKDSN
jgi:hypothetical protein